jgi:hypothetical protein
MTHWLAHILGLDDPSGYWYLWWSGFGGRFTLGGALIVTYVRHHNCHERGCWRLGHCDESGKPVCRHHHPR